MRASPAPSRRYFALPLLAACVWLAACGAPGAPQPPRPIVPRAVGDLAAHQQGSSVVLTFTLPRKSDDGENLAEPPDIEIFRGERRAGASAKLTTRLVYTVPSAVVDTYLHQGQIEFRDPLQPASLSGQEMVYMVRTRASKKRASPDSNVVSVRALPVPAPPLAVHGTVTESAIALSWNPPAATALASGASAPAPYVAGYRVYRAEVDPATKVPENLTPAAFAQLKLRAPLELLGPAAGPSFRDTTFAFGAVYVYTVRTVAEVQDQSVESSDSDPFVITPQDTFPPAAPLRLVSVIIPATESTSAHVELSWDISPEPDLAGYRVYRSEQPDTSGQRLNTELLLTPAFRDMTAVRGKQYVYRVTAVDRAGNESSLSSPVSAEVPQLQP